MNRTLVISIVVAVVIAVVAVAAFSFVQQTPTAEGGATVDGPEQPGETVAGPAVSSSAP